MFTCWKLEVKQETPQIIFLQNEVQSETLPQNQEYKFIRNDTIIEEIHKQTQEAAKKKFNFENVELDLELVETHKKLVNTLLLAGVVNILSQSEAFEVVEERVKVIE